MTESIMKIILNGQEKQLTTTQSLNQLIEQFCKQNNRVIAELNGEIVKSQQWANTSLQDGDKIELVGFVGGG